MSGVEHPDVLRDLARQLWAAEEAAQPTRPPTEQYPTISVDDAYAIQDRNLLRRTEAGAQVVGHKVSQHTPALVGSGTVHDLALGTLTDRMIVPEGNEIVPDKLIQPRAIAQQAFVLADGLAGPGVTTGTAMAVIAGVMPAIEIVDSRILDWNTQLLDMIADNAASGRVVLGGRLTSLRGLDLRLMGMLLYRNGEPIESGTGASVQGDPARCVAWLANTLGASGGSLHRGEIVLPGAMHRMVPVRPGDVFRAEFAHLGPVTACFADQGGAP